MGNILSEQSATGSQQGKEQKNINKSQNWQTLERSLNKQILRSKKTSLIVQRYWFQMQNHEDFQQQNKIYEWRNNNPNAQFMVNVLSVGKDQTNSQNQSFQCGSIDWCPSQKLGTKIYVVTERILKLSELKELLDYQKYIKKGMEKNKSRILYATDDSNKKEQKTFQKYTPFINFKFSQLLFTRILEDWIRGIEVLCYKFGYFKINHGNLGITSRKRGTVWINQNYAVNYLRQQDKVQVTTADQKFRFQKQTINKIIQLTANFQGCKSLYNRFQQRKPQKFDDFCQIIRSPIENVNKQNQVPLQNKHNNTSLFVQQGSFLASKNNITQNNSSFFVFDHKNALQRVNSNKRITSNQKILVFPQFENNYNSPIFPLTNSGSSLIKYPEAKRSNTGQRVSTKVSPQSKQQIVFVNSNHKYCGKQTAPTNELGHSSSLQSVNHLSNIKCNFDEMNRHEGRTLFKSQKTKKVQNDNSPQDQMFKPSSSPSNKVCIHQRNRQQFSSEPYISRSQTHTPNGMNSPRQNITMQNIQQCNHKHYKHSHNYSLDQHNIVGPYKKDRFYSNLKKQKIALVDSMVMVREQSQEIQDDIHNGSRAKYVLEESIILMGNQAELR